MGLFGQSTSFDADVEKATSETNTNDNWSLILDVCDKVTTNPRGAKECLKSIMKRMGHTDPHVQMQAITLLDACSNNCGKPFHLEIASREFVNEYRRLLSKAQPKVSMKMRQVLKGWVEGDFKSDPELDLIPALYQTLRRERVEFNNLTDKPAKTSAKLTAAAYKDPNVVSSQQEEDDIAKAIELSLKETKGGSPKHSASNPNTSSSAYPSLYPTVSGSLGSIANATATESSQSSAPVEARKVRALYDFEAAEENELTFFAGEIIHVTDDSDPNWWKGYNQRGDGLFPSNFVTADLSVDPERLDINQQHKSKQSQDAEQLAKTEAAAAAAMAASNQPVEIDEPKVDRLLHLLHEANPEDPSQDTPEMLQLEQEVHQMGPLIDAELERVDRKHAQLTQLSSDLVDAINLYHSLMASDRAALAGSGGYAGAMPGLGGYQAAANPQMMYGPGPGPGPSGYFSPQHNSHQMPGGYAGVGQLNSLPYNPANASISGMSSLPPNAAAAAAGAGMPNAYGQPVPMQYRNGDNWNQGNGYPPQQTTNGVNLPNGQHQPPTTQQQMPLYQNTNVADPQQYSSMPPQQQQAPPHNRQFMSPQHQPQAPPPSQQPPPPQNPLQYMPAPAGAPAGMPYASMPPNGPQNAYMPPQQQQQQLPPQSTAASNTLPTLHQAPPQSHPSTEQQYSQLHQQFNAMSMAMPPQQQQQPGVGVGMPQTMANIPIYQQQR